MTQALLERRSAVCSSGGAVVAGNATAAHAGAHVLRRGGNAADAAVATAAVLCAADPANCGIGGYGGFAVVMTASGQASQIIFNAAVPQCARDGRIGRGAGRRVTPPAVAAGLFELSHAFGRLGAKAAFAPAIELAAEGFAVGHGLAHALAHAHARHRGLNEPFRRTFMPNGSPLREGDVLVQPALARTLGALAESGTAALRDERLTESVMRTVNDAGGALVAEDFRSVQACVAEAVAARYCGCDVYVSDPEQCGASILLAALNVLDGVRLGANRQDRYVDAVGNALAAAWRRRDEAYSPLSAASSQTAHLCVADEDGMLVSLTLTHGPVWFGSGLLDDETGILLNCGMHILARRTDGAVVAQPHLTPAIVCRGETRYALGSPGGRRIPAIVLQAIIDLVGYGEPIDTLFDAPRLSAHADGTLEAEAELVASLPGRSMQTIDANEYFGPAGALEWTAQGTRVALDPRFADACAAAACR